MSEHDKAKKWRERLNLSRRDLADLTGYSYEAIVLFERGATPRRTWSTSARREEAGKLANSPRGSFAWQRYRRVCHSVHVELQGSKFSW